MAILALMVLAGCDVDARRFDGVRDAGGLVLPAASARELTGTLDMLISGKILLER